MQEDVLLGIRGTKFKMKKIIYQHKKDGEFGRTISSAVARQPEQLEHEMDWRNAECLEKEKRLIP